MLDPAAIAAALDEAAIEEVKKRFAALCDNLASGEARETALGLFAKGIKQVMQMRAAALALIEGVVTK